MDKKYGFVVLNYMNYKDTIECVNSILNINRTDYLIVIVDNRSPNDSYRLLNDYYICNKNIITVHSRENLGYSGGNNVGIALLKERNVNNIIIATNDTVLMSSNILDVFDGLCDASVGIVGPNILSLDGTQQNPPIIVPSLLYFLNLYFYKPMKCVRDLIYKLFPVVELKRIKAVEASKQKIIKNLNNVSGFSAPKKVYMLHGAFFFLTKSFTEKIGMLDNNIFMYGEEDLLSWQCEQNGLSRLLVSSITVLHKERKSTELMHKASKNKFIEINTLKSRKYLVKKIKMIEFLIMMTRYRVLSDE